MGHDQRVASRQAGRSRTHSRRQSTVHQCRLLDGANRCSVARPAGTVRGVEFSVPAIQSLVQAGRMGTPLGGLPRSRSRMSYARFNHHPRPSACGGGHQKNGDDEALGRSRGGFSTKIHTAVDAEGRPVELVLTPGQEHDICQAPRLLADHEPDYVIADKGYDSDEFVEQVKDRGSKPVIPSRSGRTAPRRLLKRQYRRRNLVERFVNRIKHFRRIATRYEKTARNFLGFLTFAALFSWLPNVNTT